MSGEAKTVSELCREALELREKSPFVPKENWSFDDDSRTVDCSECGTEVDVSGFIVKSSDEHQAVDIHLYGMEKICKPQAEFIVFAANHIKAIAERCLELEHRLPVFIKNDPTVEQIQMQEAMIASMKQLQKEIILLREQKNEALKRAQHFNDELSDLNFTLRQENQKLREALSVSRGQWIHSVNKDQCLEALKGGQGG